MVSVMVAVLVRVAKAKDKGRAKVIKARDKDKAVLGVEMEAGAMVVIITGVTTIIVVV